MEILPGINALHRLAVLVLAACLTMGPVRAQESDTLSSRSVIVHTDPRLDVLVKRQKQVLRGMSRSQRGYRVQIYSGNDRHKANEIRVDFMKRFPQIRTYLTYVQPQFRVKVGDFINREEARELYLKVSPLYSPCMIVPDIVQVNP